MRKCLLAVCKAKLENSLSFIVLLFAGLAAAQTDPNERALSAPKAEVEKVVENLQSSARGRLPVLDGFVGKVQQPLDHYERGYYQCSIQLKSLVTGDTQVRIAAKITAWYSDPNNQQTGYQVLPSNGRLESDLLDRIEDALGVHPLPPAASNAPSNIAPRFKRTLDATEATPRTSIAGSAGPSLLPSTSTPVNTEDIVSLQQKREAVEKQIQQLNASAQNLEEILRNQVRPTNLIIVKNSGTRVHARPQEGTKFLFAAEANDEFEYLNSLDDWVHVQISGASRGWIRRSQLEMPEALAALASKSNGQAAADREPFRLAREETNTFPGTWAPLSGKTVKILWVQPITPADKPTIAQAKRNYAKSLFSKVLAEVATSDLSLAGILVVFDSADGGEVAVTLPIIRQWKSGNLSEGAFWQQCLIDPPEVFQDLGTR